MQFQYNSDYIGVTATGQAIPMETLPSRDPIDFPPAQPIPCARITTRVFHPSRNQVAMVQDVLVRTMMTPQPMTAIFSSGNGGNNDQANNINLQKMNSFSDSSSSMSSSSSDDTSMSMDDGAANNAASIMDDQGDTSSTPQIAYWVQRTVREAIYGRVLFCVVLKKRPRPLILQDGAEWEATTDQCAVKEMSWEHIRRERDRLAEDPIKEVSSMQYIQEYFVKSKQQQQKSMDSTLGSRPGVAESFQAMLESNIMMPLDLLSDERNLYSVMPYCDGGELFERLDAKERFSEEESRYWMDQVLNGLENLQHMGICHRDMSLENLLVHKDGALIIDMGMCLLLPFQENSTSTIIDSFSNMNVNGGNVATTPNPQPSNGTSPSKGTLLSGRSRPRYLVRPQGTCGKWIYMSPEIYQNSAPFDGFAVDMWAAGVILFLMLTGFPPWERACPTDERFHYMTTGYLVQMLTEWELGLSSDAMDLLQRMMFVDPKDRLSLDQVRAHPWMVNGRRAKPFGLNG